MSHVRGKHFRVNCSAKVNVFILSFVVLVFIGDMMPNSAATPVQQPQTIIEIRPYRGGWQCYEDSGVQPYWTGDTAKQDAIGYAKARAKFGREEIRVLNADGSIKDVIQLDGTIQDYD